MKYMLKNFHEICVCVCLLQMLLFGIILIKVIESRITPSNCIFLKVSRAFSKIHFCICIKFHILMIYKHPKSTWSYVFIMHLVRSLLDPIYSSTFFIHFYQGIYNHNIWWKNILKYSFISVYNFLLKLTWWHIMELVYLPHNINP